MKPVPTFCPFCGTRWYDPSKKPSARCDDQGCLGRLVAEPSAADVELVQAGIRYYQDELERLKDELRARGWDG